MMRWWRALSLRERRILLLMAVVLLLFLSWLMAWRPLAQAHQATAVELDRIVADLAWMEAAAVELNRLQGAGRTKPQPRQGLSLLALAEQTARANGLSQAFRRGEPDGADRVRVWLEQAAFDQLIRWLELLEAGYGVGVADASVDKSENQGVVDVRILLVDRSPASSVR